MAAVAAAIAALAVTPLVAPPAGAIAIRTGASSFSPVTWVDGAGRQVEVVGWTAEGGTGGQLLVARDQATGIPDASYGLHDGRRGLAAVPLARSPEVPEAARIESRIAADDTGTVTTAWRAEGCAASDICDRWLVRYDLSGGGAVLGGTALLADAPPIGQALDDGSFLTGLGGDPLGWVGPDGAGRDAPDLAVDELQGADVDASGRLLALDVDGELVRQPQSGPNDLTVSTGCTSPGAVGAALDGGFAVACRAGSPAAFTVTRHLEDGSVAWTSSGTDPSLPIDLPSRVAVDALDRVWVGTAARPALFPGLASPPVVVAAFTAAGPTALGASRPTSGGDPSFPWTVIGGGVTDLRAIGDGTEVAYADLDACCRYPNNTTFASSARGAILPFRPSPPVCPLPTPTVRTTAPGTVEVTFSPCTAGRSNQQPTGYRVVAAGPSAGSWSTLVDGAGSTSATLTGLPHGPVLGFAVIPFNEQGDDEEPGPEVRTVLPFSSLEAFVDVQVVTLHQRPVTGPARQALIDALRTGERTAGDELVELLGRGAAVERVEPLVRLYRAFFLRDPDRGGLDYWARRRAAGVRLVDVAERFARSSEFVRRYGALSDRAFVELVYRNVFDRNGDPGGISYWTRKVGAGTPRGTVMAQMSESSEHVGRSAPIVRPITAAFTMVGRLPTAAERARWLTEADPYRTVPLELLADPAYVARWAGL
ncbi:MAG: DUF4214 domain-containing protein [Acidimicrobiales bacterium]|nr:DUF4214 domain-containing protein [Acidimicrobiales bacterium]